MNKYYVTNEQFNSNKRIFEAYYKEAEIKPSILQRVADFWLALLSVLTSERARTVAKAASVALCLIGLIGIAGAIENGTLSIGVGILVATVLLGIEFFSLKKSGKRQAR